MRIGILTLPLHTNYGGILQAYALQTVLERMGHDVKVIDYDYLYPRPTYWKLVKRQIKTILGMRTLSVNYEKNLNRPEQIKRKYTQAFINKYIHRLVIKNIDIELSENMFDCIVVGSDQVWRPEYNRNICNMFLDFAKTWKIKRIAYAASFGTEKWNVSVEESIKCKELLHLFDMISVREKSAVKLCQHLFDLKVHQTLDPTLLLSKEDYIAMLKKNNVSKSNGNMFVYLLDDTEDKREMVNHIAAKKNLVAFEINLRQSKQATNSLIPQPPVEKWIRGFLDAECVVTDSFHACVFSVIFNKPFVVCVNEHRGATRFYSLFDQLALEKNSIRENYMSFNSNSPETGIKLELLRKQSLSLLESCLEEQQLF